MNSWIEERRSHMAADGVNRADAGLRRFGRKVGEATMCPRCDGGGYVVGRAFGRTLKGRLEMMDDPVKCPTCKGEGLDPDVHGRQG
jgi:predicted Zn-ribbon and HTH transcriptional regulator